jgi:soluble lytic murein transglycosylase-like protein
VVALTSLASAMEAPTPAQEVRQLIETYGRDLSTTTREQIYKVIKCESAFDAKAVGKLGEVGLSQIYLKYHPSVTLKEALDPDFAVNFIIDGFRKGKQSWWTCHKKLF